jgi:gliding motility-associated-like protein
MKCRLLLLLLFVPVAVFTQTYHTNGSAYSENCNCYTLTDAVGTQSGSVWNKIKINLTQSFDYKFDINLGSKDNDGADGMVFVLQNISVNIGTTGGGLGFSGVKPSIGILIDTYQNTDQNDPVYDHISINRDGDVNHNSANNLDGPVRALSNSDNIEDGQWHKLRVIWDATTKKLSAQIDGVDRVQTTLDLVTQVFSNDPEVFWGFTAATGGSNNRQRFCTSLNPGFVLAPNQLTCFPIPIQFNDNSVSFGTILKWYWDFGDGSIDSVKTPVPHIYAAPGVYDVKLNILANNGCVSDTFKTKVIVGSKPVAAYSLQKDPVCTGDTLVFIDASTVQYGSINSWGWSVDNGTPIVKGSADLLQKLPTGPHSVSLEVRTKEGCISNPVVHATDVMPPPSVDMSFVDACFREPVEFTGINNTPAVGVRQWYWQTEDGTKDSSAVFHPVFSKGGTYNVKLYAQADNGCYSLPIQKQIKIYETKAFAGNDTIVADNYPFPLKGSGGELYKWSPPDGLSNPDIANPLASVKKDVSYILTAYTPLGCATSDTIKIKVFKGPAIYMPNVFSPNRDNRNDRFRAIAVGISEFGYLRIYNRYGQLVYHSSSAKDGWDGTLNGVLQPSGMYVWMVSGKDFLGKVHESKGTVVLAR